MRKKLIMGVFLMINTVNIQAHSKIDSFGTVHLRLENFYAVEKENGKIDISFKIAEVFLIIDRYEVWKSTDNVNYILAASTNRNSASAPNYSVTNQLTIAERNAKTIYYKIRQVAMDGGYTDGYILPLHIKNTTLQNFSICPNPMKQMAQIVVKTTKDEKLELLIYNTSGQRVQTEIISGAKGMIIHNFSLKENLVNGFYIFQLKQNGILIDAKTIVKQ